ncbi:hypothetical protein XfCFBP8082_08930 [Xylella fastidiosa subsp. fastidiosa]|jgi:hypothetical protein|nr:hypothetical protein XFEB_00082 [Xylella fastidiosa EB92.1]KAF0570724.1 hypothetical protein P305_11410 [Xylella fastidiosa subsp. fastidiosa Mus-1]RWA30496.1 hypothetical protein XfCFBP8071_08830 [Xylella fastidiosa subsp. fastidiosa]TNW07167.1 hypothetical protein C5H19_09525 [Xylella fastidiosa]RWA34664.1 hypothetical protein XfCFBP7970_09600 [Xylella fastidiosa subsp. fastidiosa]
MHDLFIRFTATGRLECICLITFAISSDMARLQLLMFTFVLEVTLISDACLAHSVRMKVQDQLTECYFLLPLCLFRSVDRLGDD